MEPSTNMLRNNSMKKSVRLGFLLAAMFFGFGSAFAQTSTDGLDKLFAQLRDPASAAQAPRIEPQIWSAWMQGGTAAENDVLALATASLNLGALPLAEKQLNALLATQKNFPEAWNKRATLYFMMGRLDESLADIEKVLELEPRHFGALSGRGMIYQRQGKNAEALAAFKEALSMNPNMPGALFAVKQLEKLLPEL
jgi:tetratricopeptide (TPR) repeat protein